MGMAASFYSGLTLRGGGDEDGGSQLKLLAAAIPALLPPSLLPSCSSLSASFRLNPVFLLPPPQVTSSFSLENISGLLRNSDSQPQPPLPPPAPPLAQQAQGEQQQDVEPARSPPPSATSKEEDGKTFAGLGEPLSLNVHCINACMCVSRFGQLWKRGGLCSLSLVPILVPFFSSFAVVGR